MTKMCSPSGLKIWQWGLLFISLAAVAYAAVECDNLRQRTLPNRSTDLLEKFLALFGITN